MGARKVKNNLFALREKCLHQGPTFLFLSSLQLPRLLLRPWKGFLSCQGALQGPTTRLVHCFWNYRDTETLVKCGRLGAKVLGHYQEQLSQTLIVHLVVTHTSFLYPKTLEGPGAPLPPPLRPNW